MSLFGTAAAWLTDALTEAAGVPVTYRRPPALAGVPLTAVVATSPAAVTQPGQASVRTPTDDRDFLFRRGDLAAAGLFPPAVGDRVTETAAGRLTTFVAAERQDGAVWEWGEPDRVTVRVRCVPKL